MGVNTEKTLFRWNVKKQLLVKCLKSVRRELLIRHIPKLYNTRGLQPKHPHTVPALCWRESTLNIHAHLLYTSFIFVSRCLVWHFYNTLIKASMSRLLSWKQFARTDQRLAFVRVGANCDSLDVARVACTNLNLLTWPAVAVYASVFTTTTLCPCFLFVLLLLSSLPSISCFSHVFINNVTGSVLCMLPSGAIGRSAMPDVYVVVDRSLYWTVDWLVGRQHDRTG